VRRSAVRRVDNGSDFLYVSSIREGDHMTMRLGVLVVLLAGCVACAPAQLKTQAVQEARVPDALAQGSAPMFLFGWFDPTKFSMRQSVDFSYATMGGQGVSLGTYTNSMMYEFSEKLNMQADLSLSYSPYNSFSTFNGRKNDLSGLTLSRAQVNYRPWENVIFQVQYRQIPYMNSLYYSPFANPWFREGGF
jgi:hypothetical protein